MTKQISLHDEQLSLSFSKNDSKSQKRLHFGRLRVDPRRKNIEAKVLAEVDAIYRTKLFLPKARSSAQVQENAVVRISDSCAPTATDGLSNKN
jgi:hypothetical protein